MFLRRHKKSWIAQTKTVLTTKGGYKRIFNYFLLRLKRRPGTPEYIAKGFAIGVAINYWPILFTHLVGGYILCRIFRGDLLAMFIGTLLGNPWTFAMVYPLCYKLGKTLIGLRPRHRIHYEAVTDVWSQIWPIHSWHSLSVVFQEILIPLALGGALLALPSAMLGYYLARNAVRVYQSQRRKLVTKQQFRDVEKDIDVDAP